MNKSSFLLILLMNVLFSCNKTKENKKVYTPAKKNNYNSEKMQSIISNKVYYRYNPDSISNLKIDGFNVYQSHQIQNNKIVAGYYNPVDDQITNPDSEKDYGARLLFLNDKNEIKYKSKGIGDLYLYKPYFYKNDENDKIVIVSHLAYEYFFGGDAFLIENGEIEYIGNIDIEGIFDKTNLIDILTINETKNGLVFSFNSDSITYKPGSEDIILKNNNIRYQYYNKVFKLIK